MGSPKRHYFANINLPFLSKIDLMKNIDLTNSYTKISGSVRITLTLLVASPKSGVGSVATCTLE